jgi:hypothetical protein
MAFNINAMITKVRRLTRSPSQAQISDNDIVEYINTFVLYDFPEHLRTFNFHETFSWTCNPYQDVYPIDQTAYPLNRLNNFKNLYLTINPPVYIAGFQQMYCQSREQFFGIYPEVRSIASIGKFGDGVTTQFTGQINTQQTIIAPGQNINASLLQNKVLFSSVDSNGNGLAMFDRPIINPLNGNPTINGNLYPSGSLPVTPIAIDPNNTINYKTGVYTVTFQDAALNPVAPGPQVPIDSQTVQVQLARPQALLFYDNAFTLRPVPDQPYTIQFEVYKRPLPLNEIGHTDPELEEYWQLWSYGGAMKLLQDRMDMDTVALIQPEYLKQMNLCLRRTIKQNSTQRVATIYTENVASSSIFGFGQGGDQF